MAIQGLDYWYDGQITRFLEQVVAAFSGFKYMTGYRNGSPPQLVMVPCRMVPRSRAVANIINNNSENSLNAVPMITVDMSGFSFRSADLQSPTHIDTRQVVERALDSNGNYTGEKGNSYTVQRLMPRPFLMTVQIDLWTSNQLQKFQLMEQIATTMYPFVEIQNSDNALDWTAKTTMTLEDDVNWTSRSMPIGTENEIDVLTITGKIPIWLTPPAKVMQQRRIEQITANINASSSSTELFDGTPGSLIAQNITTVGNHWVEAIDGTLKLLGPEGAEHDPAGNVYRWDELLPQYGTLSPTESEIRLKKVHDVESDQEIIGTIQYDVNHPNVLFWQIDADTLPANTIGPINAYVNPLSRHPGNGLPPAATGQRYLLAEDIGNSAAWGFGLSAKANDVIQYTGTAWVVAFTAATSNSTEFVINLTTGKQYRWDGHDWTLAVNGAYSPGYWRIRL